MAKGCLFAFLSVVVSGVLFALLLPLVARNMPPQFYEGAGRVAGPIILVVAGTIGFLIGNRKSQPKE